MTNSASAAGAAGDAPPVSSPEAPAGAAVSPVSAGSGGSAAASGISIRTLQEDGWEAWTAVLNQAFGGAISPESFSDLRSVIEFDRSLAAFDGSQLVGAAGSYSFQLSVQGGELVPTAGVTTVGVRPTHRRRGVLRSLMRRQLDEVRERGEPLAALTATEGAIYGRFGYGLATQRLQASIPRRRVGLTAEALAAAAGFRVRDADIQESLDECERIYAAAALRRGGILARSAESPFRQWGLADPESRRRGASALRCVLVEDADGAVAGYARFRIKMAWEETGGEGAVHVESIFATHPGAYAALWRHLLDTDLCRDVEAGDRPVDDPLLSMLTDRRPVRTSLKDMLYLRPVEVGAALAARRYLGEVDVVLEVEDAFCPWNSGRWRLSGDDKGAVCSRTDDAAELALGARELGAIYLGGIPLTALADAGRVREIREGALVHASRAFAADRAPWLSHGF
jgi:predicted acetyltransferase